MDWLGECNEPRVQQEGMGLAWPDFLKATSGRKKIGNVNGREATLYSSIAIERFFIG